MFFTYFVETLIYIIIIEVAVVEEVKDPHMEIGKNHVVETMCHVELVIHLSGQ